LKRWREKNNFFLKLKKINRSTRCLSYSNLLDNQTLISELAQIPLDTQYRCTFDRAQECKCPDCVYERKQPAIFEEIERIGGKKRFMEGFW